jgi:hypothetical protein
LLISLINKFANFGSDQFCYSSQTTQQEVSSTPTVTETSTTTLNSVTIDSLAETWDLEPLVAPKMAVNNKGENSKFSPQ